MRRQAIRCALSALARDEQLVFVDEFKLDAPKTKDVQAALDALAAGQSALVLLADANENVQSGINNIPDAMYLRASYLNIRDLLKFDKVIVPMDALQVIRGIWGREG
jgi:large subunit ribosomal protein L4